jgi:alginate O-acetyltransferase complex protein AlgI
VLFATYVAYFPQLVAGPIERAHALLPRLSDTSRSRPDRSAVESALGLIVLGLFKKVVIADGVATVADALFDQPENASTITAAIGVIAFSLQIYGDFSGYTDIARGVSQLFGVDLVVNFRQPYLSRNLTEFWRRWHISLSNWLRDYLYIPLGGNRGGRLATHRNLMITMLLGGLWHGASWNFILWGGLHGVFLIVDRARGASVPEAAPRLLDAPAMMATFVLVSLTWVFFRAENFRAALDVFGAFGRTSTAFDPGHLVLVVVLASLMLSVDLVARFAGPSPDVVDRRPVPAGLSLGVALVALIVFSGSAARPFVYFQF